jgi:hypothetical protein
VRWSVTIPGQPVSWDTAYRMGRMPVKRRGVAVLNADGAQKTIHRPVMTDAGAIWKRDVQLLVQSAKPSKFKPTGQIRVIVDLYLSHDMDDDNAMKLTRDAAAKALGLDDIQFLVCTRTKEIVSDHRHARVELTFDDNPRSH